jgi:ATP-binding cassette subfamily B protein
MSIDGESLSAEQLDLLRRHTAWVDPSVQLWNASMLVNLLYGHEQEHAADVDGALRGAELLGVLGRLPDGLSTGLGESGRLVSGGEGQRVRLGRAWLHERPRLVILDEPFRGLDRDARARLLERARARFRDATLVCITHDVSDTLDFPRVLVLADGGIAEDGVPRELACDGDSRYAGMLAEERALRERTWAGMRSVSLHDGELTAESGLPAEVA